MAWAGTPVQAAGAIPLMNAAGTVAVNTAANYRMGFLGSLLAPAPGGPMSWRAGVLPTALATGATVNSDLSTWQTATASSSIGVYPGNCVIPRSGAAGGPYVVNFPSVSTLVTDPAPSTNPRIDVVAVQLTDAALGDVGTQGGQLMIVNGVAGASPAVPTLPTGCIPLAQLYRATNTTTVAQAAITDVRKSTSAYGGMRALLPGDLSSDPGSYIGECAFDAVTSFKSGPRYWDGTTWRGILTTVIPFTLNIGLTQYVYYGTNYQLCTAVVPDPGYPYYLRVSAKSGGSNQVSPAEVITYVTLSSGETLSWAWSTMGSNSIWECHNTSVFSPKLTGARTVNHVLILSSSGTSAAMSNNVYDIYLNVEIIPA